MKTGRRGWLAGVLPTAVDAVAEIPEVLPSTRVTPRRRPPGAVDETSFLSLCLRCDECVDACPHDAVHTYVPGSGELSMTPVMRPERRACHMCDGFPCAAACEVGALVVPVDRLVRLGKVRIVRDRCFTYMGPECGACAGVCPEGVEAIRMVGTHPQVDEDACIGCGLCIEACPTIPAAIEMVPLNGG